MIGPAGLSVTGDSRLPEAQQDAIAEARRPGPVVDVRSASTPAQHRLGYRAWNTEADA